MKVVTVKPCYLAARKVQVLRRIVKPRCYYMYMDLSLFACIWYNIYIVKSSMSSPYQIISRVIENVGNTVCITRSTDSQHVNFLCTVSVVDLGGGHANFYVSLLQGYLYLSQVDISGVNFYSTDVLTYVIRVSHRSVPLT